jgi:hypothetical protein
MLTSNPWLSFTASLALHIHFLVALPRHICTTLQALRWRARLLDMWVALFEPPFIRLSLIRARRPPLCRILASFGVQFGRGGGGYRQHLYRYTLHCLVVSLFPLLFPNVLQLSSRGEVDWKVQRMFTVPLLALLLSSMELMFDYCVATSVYRYLAVCVPHERCTTCKMSLFCGSGDAFCRIDGYDVRRSAWRLTLNGAVVFCCVDKAFQKRLARGLAGSGARYTYECQRSRPMTVDSRE